MEVTMAGLYEGLEEVGFKRTADGYVFQTNSRWFIGPKRRYLVTEAQKAEIAACIRDTLRFLKPIALAAAVLIPVTIAGAVFWLASLGGTLTVTETHGGETTTYTQSIGLTGSTGTLKGPDSHVVFHVSGPPSDRATVTVTGFGSNGQSGTPAVMMFGADGSNVWISGEGDQVLASAHLSGRAGATNWAIALDVVAVALALYLPYLAFIHIYSVRRLEPLLVGLPRSETKITMREGAERFAAKMSVKLLVVMVGGTALGLAGTLVNLIQAIVDHHLINAEILAFGAAGFGGAAIYYTYLVFLRFKRGRQDETAANQ
jgi:hypothetical protein